MVAVHQSIAFADWRRAVPITIHFGHRFVFANDNLLATRLSANTSVRFKLILMLFWCL